MAMTLLLVLGAVAEQRHVAAPCQLLDQPQRELLAVVLDGGVVAIDCAVGAKLASIPPDELRPGHLATQHRFQEPFAWTEGWHPHVVARGAHATAAESRGE